MPLTRAAVLPTGNAIAIGPRCSAADAPQPSLANFEDATKVPSFDSMPAEALPLTLPLKQADAADARNRPLVVVGGGVSGVWAAITLRELGYTNVTILEKERRVGGNVRRSRTPANPTRSARWARRSRSRRRRSATRHGKGGSSSGALALGRAGRRLRVLNANNLVESGDSWQGGRSRKRS